MSPELFSGADANSLC